MAFGFFLLPTRIPLLRLFGRLRPSYSRRFAQILNAGTVPFNLINALVPRIGGRIFSHRMLSTTFDWIYVRIMHLLDSIPEEELALGMYYPDRWEPLFQSYMTLEDLFRYPTTYLQCHLDHLSP